MDKVRLGLVGFGGMGSAHAHCVYSGEVDGMVLSAVCDSDERKRESSLSLYPDVPVFEKYTEMFRSSLIDAVLIATPHYLHPVIGEEAFSYGLSVLTEKPVAVSVSKAKEFISSAGKSGKIFSVMFQWRRHPLFEKAHEIIKNGELGEIKHLVWIVTNWYRTQAYYDSGSWRATWNGEGGGVLLNQAPHNLDQIWWLCGLPKKISADIKIAHYHNITVEDDAIITGELENGGMFSFITTTGEYPGTNRLEISGSRGRIILEDNKLKITRLSMDEEEYRFNSEKYSSKPEYTTEIIEGSGNEDSYHRAILQDFADAVLKGKEIVTPGETGINELMISNAAYLSSWLGRPVELPFDSALFDEELEKRKKEEKEHNLERKVKITGPSTEYNERWFVKW